MLSGAALASANRCRGGHAACFAGWLLAVPYGRSQGEVATGQTGGLQNSGGGTSVSGTGSTASGATAGGTAASGRTSAPGGTTPTGTGAAPAVVVRRRCWVERFRQEVRKRMLAFVGFVRRGQHPRALRWAHLQAAAALAVLAYLFPRFSEALVRESLGDRSRDVTMTRSRGWPLALAVGLLAAAHAGCGGRVGGRVRGSSSDAGALSLGGALEDGRANGGRGLSGDNHAGNGPDGASGAVAPSGGSQPQGDASQAGGTDAGGSDVTGGGTATGGAVQTGGRAGTGGVVESGGAGGTAGDASAGAGGAVGYCSGDVRESGLVPFGIGAPGASGAAGAAAAPDPCEPNPCERGAACVAHQGRALCDCDPGILGDRCELAVRTIASGGGYCAISAEGTLSCWSAGGDRTNVEEDSLAVAVGSRHYCAIRGDCTLTCGADFDDDYGAAIPPSGGFTAIASGEDYSCGIRADGTLACWGLDDAGQASPPQGVFVAIAAGSRHCCAIRTDGALTCWGEDQSGAASPPEGTFEAIAAYGTYNCAIRTDGTVACWGTTLDLDAPPDGVFTAIAAGCGITRDDLRLRCWHGSRL